MRRSVALIAIVLCLPAAAYAAPRWTFCVASSQAGKDIWITEVFPAERDRQRLEDVFKSMVERTGAERADAQCPFPRDDKTEAVNARFAAEEFNRKLGATLHAVMPTDFPPRR